jgi:hypothetical protein
VGEEEEVEETEDGEEGVVAGLAEVDEGAVFQEVEAEEVLVLVGGVVEEGEREVVSVAEDVGRTNYTYPYSIDESVNCDDDRIMHSRTKSTNSINRYRNIISLSCLVLEIGVI